MPKCIIQYYFIRLINYDKNYADQAKSGRSPLSAINPCHLTHMFIWYHRNAEYAFWYT